MSTTGTIATWAAAALIATALAGCTKDAQGVRFVEGGSSKPQAQPIRNLTEPEIRTAIVGKTFQYTRSDGNGFITYNGDGSFEFQDDVKGAGTGAWSVSSGQFCESYAGAPLACGDFKSTGDAYFAAKSRLVEMKS